MTKDWSINVYRCSCGQEYFSAQADPSDRSTWPEGITWSDGHKCVPLLSEVATVDEFLEKRQQ